MFSRYLDFCLDVLVMYKKSLIRGKLYSKFMTSQTAKQRVVIHILFNISWSKGNKKIKFGPLIEYNMRNIFLEKSYPKCGTETIPRSFSKKSKLSIHIVYWGIKAPQKHPLSFLPRPLSNLQIVQDPPFWQSPLYIGFLWTPLKIGFFSKPL